MEEKQEENFLYSKCFRARCYKISRPEPEQTYEDEMSSDELVSLAYTFSTQFLKRILFWILSI